MRQYRRTGTRDCCCPKTHGWQRSLLPKYRPGCTSDDATEHWAWTHPTSDQRCISVNTAPGHIGARGWTSRTGPAHKH